MNKEQQSKKLKADAEVCGVFELPDPSPSVHLLLQLNAILWLGEESEVILKTYLWTAIPIFDNKKGLMEFDSMAPFYKFKPDSSIFSPSFYKDIYKPIGSKKLKTIPGNFTLQIQEISKKQAKNMKETAGQMYGSGIHQKNKVKPNNKKKPGSVQTEKIMLHTFSDSHLELHNKSLNILFVYPEICSLTGVKAQKIAVKIQYLESSSIALNSEDDQYGIYKHLPTARQAIHSKVAGQTKCYSVLTSINNHNKMAIFNDEFKIDLPNHLTESHHLLFTIYYLSINKSGSLSPSKPSHCLGYAFLPVLQHGRILGQKQNLAITTKLPEDYTHPENYHTIKWMEGGKGLLKIRSTVESNVFSTSDIINDFLNSNSFLSNHPALFPIEVMWGLVEASDVQVVRFLPLILNQLFTLISLSNYSSLIQNAFFVIILIIKKVEQSMDKKEAKTMLIHYINNIFDITRPLTMKFQQESYGNTLSQNEQNKEAINKSKSFPLQALFEKTDNHETEDHMHQQQTNLDIRLKEERKNNSETMDYKKNISAKLTTEVVEEELKEGW
eukprot:CAMPEP_0174256434 /NCGR_PEP_ID=MMETSP0439-20130205/5662_1 /TAXON_ID=0 /ORGANISM="Stereomyxa ramosa, Strain Chinc5" /LENGTH=553 /DNA_ID=CAMNT_0015339029 /DNA_START=1102 /DNA_END=2760 /DNA_ORIENTATION=+